MVTSRLHPIITTNGYEKAVIGFCGVNMHFEASQLSSEACEVNVAGVVSHTDVVIGTIPSSRSEHGNRMLGVGTLCGFGLITNKRQTDSLLV